MAREESGEEEGPSETNEDDLEEERFHFRRVIGSFVGYEAVSEDSM